MLDRIAVNAQFETNTQLETFEELSLWEIAQNIRNLEQLVDSPDWKGYSRDRKQQTLSELQLLQHQLEALVKVVQSRI